MPHQFDVKFYDDISSIGRFSFMSPYIGNGNTCPQKSSCKLQCMYPVIYDDVVYNHKIEYRQTIEPRILVLFLTFPVCFEMATNFSHLNSNCSNLLDLRNQVTS